MSRLGELLVREKLISLQQLQEAQDEAKRSGRRLGVALSKLGFVDDGDLTQFLARQYSLPSINLADFEIVAIRVDLTAEERERYDRLIATYRSAYRQFQRLAPGASWAEFASAAVRSAEGRAALRAWRESRRLVSLCAAKRAAVGELLARHRAARVLIFVADNHAAYEIAREHLVMPLTCDIGRSERAVW